MKKTLLKFLILCTILCQSILANTQKVTLQLEWKHQFEFAGFYTAIEKGYYEDIGIDLEIKEFHDGINISQDVLNGKSTFGISSSALILERLNNKPIVLIASYFKQNALALVTKPEIKSPNDLKNKKIMALDWEMGHTSLGVMLKDFGINKNDYDLVLHDYQIEKFINGEVDAMSIFTTSQPYELDKLGVNYNILNPANFGIYSYDVELFTSEDTINKHPKMVEDFVNATNKGWEYAFNNKEEIVDLIYNKYSKRKTKEALLYEANQTEQIFKTNIFKIGAIAPELIKLNADMYTNLGLVDKNLKITDLLNGYYQKKGYHSIVELNKNEKEYLKNNPKIKVHNESNWPPYNYNTNQTPKGFSIDYMNLLASKLGIQVEYISGFSWDEYIEKLKNNEIDVMLNIAKTPQREEFFNFTTNYTKSIDTVFTKKNSNLKNLDDFDGKTVAVIKAFYEEELLKKYYPNIKLLVAEDSIEALKKVAFDEADGAIDNFAVGSYYIQNNLISNLKPAFEIKDKRFNLEMHLATNKNNEILRDILEKAKAKVTEEELFKLKKKWMDEKVYLNSSNIYLTQIEQSYLNNKKEITMCVDPDWEPFEKINENKEHEGIAADLIAIISKKLNIDIKLIPTKTWEESLEFSKNKKCDILSFLNETPKRKKWLNFTNTIFKDPNVIVGRIETNEIKDLSKVKASIALPKGTAMYERFEKDFPNMMIIPVNSEEEAFTLVEQKKADLTLRSLIITAYTIKEQGLFNLKILHQPKNYENFLRIGVIKDEEILVEILNKAIEQITSNEIQTIVNKWVSIKYQEAADYTYFWVFFVLTSILIFFFLYRQYLLKHSNNHLQKEVIKRTRQLESSNQSLKRKRDELHNLNKNLELKIKEEVEKNRLIQEKLFKTDKLASMGEMISNIAHQWRQPLSVISTLATGVKLQKEFDTLSDKELILNMDLINKNAQYLSETINDFKNFIKGDRNLQNYNLSSTITNFIHLIESSIKNSNIRMILDLDDDIFIDGYPNELIQCFINIFNNSKDAYEETNQENPLFFIKTQKQNNQVIIKIKDNAQGIPQNIISKIYEPYFTTKHKSQGTGLGLHMTYKLITDGINGKIDAKNVSFEFENQTEIGVEFKIVIDL
ncbi:ABC transporter substrate-binding protein [Arcobacter aquimarinus]|uniref:histidine kinase n=8 Tax=Arcobacter aquimarinus TaxID=1315211 RepID=A0AAE7B5Z9_9BACT|nr:transporter substrate-binding domain-containing protein [Arcobacter aquimarinus]QKE26730.1 BvgS-like domain-containing signal transduction sensor histidine kinase (NMT1 domain) [Arcobacter aquimarinus]